MKYGLLLASFFVALCMTFGAKASNAKPQVSVGVNVGPAPDCPYGYYDYSPYDCAPYGYYGPDWFTSGAFIGAGPWFHGDKDFRGHVDNHFDVHHGYKGEMPHRGDRAEASRRPDHNDNFKGNEMRDGRGHIAQEREKK